MERAAGHDSASSDDVASAIWQFEPEAGLSTFETDTVDDGSLAVARSRPAGATNRDSFFSETTSEFDAASRPSAGDAVEHPVAPELFGNVLAARSRSWSGFMMGAAALVILAIGVPTGRWLLSSPVSPLAAGTLVIVTNPPGVTAFIDGKLSGTTPLNQKMAAGSYAVELRGSGPSRTIAVTVTSGGQAFQYIELAGIAADVGHLDVRSEPAGAFVTIDGVGRGISPTIVDLAPGEHTVMLSSDVGWVTQAVSIKSGVMATLAVPATSWSVVAP
jgi:hypothetical protein